MSDFEPTPPPPPPPSFQAPLPPAAPKKKAGKVAGILAVLVAVGLIAAAIGTAVTGDEEANDSPVTTQTTLQSSSPIVTAAPSSNGEAKTAVGEAVKVIGPSVVTITSDVSNGMGGNGQSAGTGIIITPEGEIVTNNHVVEGATAIMVRLAGQVDPVPATLLAADPSNDLALIKINGQDLPAATFADSNTIAVGDPVVAMGYALALDGEPTVTSGIISALNRTLAIDAEVSLDGLIQTDTAISSGNSGGPLVNLDGQVVGINTAVARDDMSSAANNVGFAISVTEILDVLDWLRSNTDGSVRVSGFLGVTIASRNDGGQGAVIQTIAPGSPASTAGLKVGDIVLEVDGQPISGQVGLVAAIRDASPGDEVTIKFERGGSMETALATLTDRPASQ
jgi:putative serine protease PepD